MFQDFSPVIFQSPVCVLLTALVFASLLPVNDVLYPWGVPKTRGRGAGSEVRTAGCGVRGEQKQKNEK